VQRFKTRDTEKYADGPDFYLYEGVQPIGGLDPLGLFVYNPLCWCANAAYFALFCLPECCKDMGAQAPLGAGGGTGCCYGKPTTCFFSPYLNPPYPGVATCIDEHETYHLNTCSCGDRQATGGCVQTPQEYNSNECTARGISVDCFDRMRTSDCSALTGEARKACQCYYAETAWEMCVKQQTICGQAGKPVPDCDSRFNTMNRMCK